MAVAAIVAFVGPVDAGPTAAPPDQADALQIFYRDVQVIVGQSLGSPTADTAPEAPALHRHGDQPRRDLGRVVAGEGNVHRAGNGQGHGRARATGRARPRRPVLDLLGDAAARCPGVDRTLPLDAFRPDGRVPGPDGHLLDAGQAFFSVVYHFYGETSYPFANRGELLTQGDDCRSSFGDGSMRQLLVLQQW